MSRRSSPVKLHSPPCIMRLTGLWPASGLPAGCTGRAPASQAAAWDTEHGSSCCLVC